MRAVVLILVGALASPAQVSFDEARFKELRKSVVRIETEDKAGAGIVLHIEGGTALALTAAHVVDSAKKITVYFADDALQRKWEAKVEFPQTFEGFGYDLAVLRLQKAGSTPPTDIPVLLAGQNPMENDIVRAIGHDADNFWIHSADSRVVRATDTNDLERFRFPNTNVAQGYSGGPVFNNRLELVGMTVQIEPGNG